MSGGPRKANFFLIGAPKAGTTSLDRLLRQNSQVYLSPIKEPCHFCPDINDQIRGESDRQSMINLNTYLNAGCPEIIHQHLVEQPEDYARLFSEAQVSDVLIGECSTFYLNSKDAPKAVLEYNPDSLFVAIIRDPVSRIRSHHKMDLRIGLESRDLTTCVKQEIDLGPRANYSNCRNYLNVSRYTEQIERWKSTVGENKVLVLVFEELIRDPDSVLDQLYQFLGLDPKYGAKNLGKENPSGGQSRFGWIDRRLYKTGLKTLLQRAVKLLLPTVGKDFLKRLYFKSTDTISGPSDDAWQRLPEVIALQAEYFELANRYSILPKPHEISDV